MLPATLMMLQSSSDMPDDLRFLQSLAREVVDSARVAPNGEIPGVGKNTTGCALRLPGGTQTYYPAFWIRDAAMMLGADLVPAEEVAGWIRVVAATQPGPSGLTFPHGLSIPPYSIPDHITLSGAACWYPGAYTDQGVGNYGFLPPADDAFFFVQMVWDRFRLTGDVDTLRKTVKTGWGESRVYEVCANAFASVECDPATGLVFCSDVPGKGRVDWGFCDSIVKSGKFLMPSLLRWQAAERLTTLSQQLGMLDRAREFRAEATKIKANLVPTFYRRLANGEGLLLSATEVGKRDDVWASAFAVSLGVLPSRVERSIARHLARLTREGGTVIEGQVRAMPPAGEFGGNWEKSGSAPGSYQNGGYWATPTGWLIVALSKVDRSLAQGVLHDYVAFVRTHRSAGAPFEWIDPKRPTFVNGNYASSAGLVYSALSQAGFYGHPR